MEKVQDKIKKQERFKNGGTSSGGRRARQEKKMFKRLKSILKKIEEEKKAGEDTQKLLESGGEERLNKPIEELTLEELNELEAKLTKMHVGIQSNINQIEASSSLMVPSKNN